MNIKNYKSFNGYLSDTRNKTISEDIDIDSAKDKIEFDYNKNDKKHINTALGKSSKNIKFEPRFTTLPNSRNKIYSVYAKESSDDTTDILKSIKGSKGNKYGVSDDDYTKFIKRVTMFFIRTIKNKPIDTFIVMESSSPLIGDIVDVLVRMMPNRGVKVYSGDSVHKDIEGLYVDRPTKMSGDEYKSLTKIVDKAKQTGVFSIKEVAAKHRSYLKGWIKIDESIYKDIKGKDVVVFDDYITTGSTLDAVCEGIRKHSPKSIMGLTTIKG